MDQFKSFKDFYPFYLQEHSDLRCRQMHFIGTSLVIMMVVLALSTQNYKILYWLPLAGYGFAWIGHYIFEKNRPATFKHPFYSLLGDFAMYADIWRGKVKITK